jgi:processive 1,2-diacylglycerol beta-glucosyltransferase
VTGIPIMPAFSERPQRSVCARELGINPALPTLILMSGGAGVGRIQSLARRLMTINRPFQLIALAGKNARLLADLRRIAAEHPGRMFPLGYTTTIERLMAASDLAITKSGGLTTSESLALGLPMIVVSPIPGQEERNADYLLEHGAAFKAYDEAGLEFRVRGLLENRQLLQTMQSNALKLGMPRAAESILHHVLDGAPLP